MPHPESAANPLVPARAIRVFFALWPDADARDRLAGAARDVAARTKGRAPPAANLHVTLAFIGDVAPERIGPLCAIGASVAASTAPFVLTLDSTGTFSRNRHRMGRRYVAAATARRSRAQCRGKLSLRRTSVRATRVSLHT
jgi:2'-5' RNA ligase